MEAIQSIKLPSFTPREQEILQLLAGFQTRIQICKILGMQYRALDKHMHIIFIKTGLHNQVEVMQYAKEHGYGIKQSSRITESLNPSMLNTQKPETVQIVTET